MVAEGEVTPAGGAHNTTKRDFLISIQKEEQARWERDGAFLARAPAEGEGQPKKFFGTFPYPYMNGMLHLGHAFSLSKLIFASAYHRLLGERVLFAQGFHLTGMPIKACADKLRYEIDTYGFQPGCDCKALVEAHARASEASSATAQDAPDPEEEKADPTKFAAKKSKAVAKQGAGSTQWEILRLSGILEADIPLFADSAHWLRFFPPLAVRDIDALGAGVDWRRSFVTTDLNPYYDRFVRWQFRKLRESGKVVKDKRYAVYSPKDGQPCADHDRATGEGAGPQEYTLIMLEALPEHLTPALDAKLGPLMRGETPGSAGPTRVFLAAATLRPETMYGQTNAWARPCDPRDPTGPTGRYGAYRGIDGHVLILTERAARNLAFQGWTETPGVLDKVADVSGDDLMGLGVRSPRAPAPVIYVLPLLTIHMDKGTGIVTSVPSDSPDDYAALADLKKKPALRERHGVTEAMVDREIVPIIRVPGVDGDAIAEMLVKQLKITSQNDADKLAKAKTEAYRRGFETGTLLVGDHKGQPVRVAKDLIRKELQADPTLARPYAEPERRVISRSDDECVVALTDQWYLIYGQEEWRRAAEDALDRMNWLDAEDGGDPAASPSKAAFQHALSWLNQWACSRSFGLGTRLPWDPQYLIESLSDSTIYMAFYTIAHILQGVSSGPASAENMYGDVAAARAGGGVSPDVLSEAVFDAIFLDKDVSDEALALGAAADDEGAGAAPPREATASPAELRAVIERCRAEFRYWYPMDLRVSGKDLIQNHLTFCLYTHIAVWGPEMTPRCFRCNGHVLLDAAKMSKSTGNFKTLEEAVAEYGADALRLGLAVAGDSMEDANFERDAANQAVLRLHRHLEWAKEALEAAAAGQLRQGDAAATYTLWDSIFSNEISRAAARARSAYETANYREVIQAVWYELGAARDAYGLATSAPTASASASAPPAPLGMHAALVRAYLDAVSRVLAPVTPHASEYVWRELLGNAGSVLTAGWPDLPPVSVSLSQAAAYVEAQKKPLMAAFEKALKGDKKKGGGAVAAAKGAAKGAADAARAPAPAAPSRATFVVVDRFGGWKAQALEVMRGAYDPSLPARFAKTIGDEVLAAVKGAPELAALPPAKLRPAVFPFVTFKAKQAREGGSQVLDAELPFDEAAVLEQAAPYLLLALAELKGLDTITVRRVRFEDLDEASAREPKLAGALPGEPAILLD